MPAEQYLIYFKSICLIFAQLCPHFVTNTSDSSKFWVKLYSLAYPSHLRYFHVCHKTHNRKLVREPAICTLSYYVYIIAYALYIGSSDITLKTIMHLWNMAVRTKNFTMIESALGKSMQALPRVVFMDHSLVEVLQARELNW